MGVNFQPLLHIFVLPVAISPFGAPMLSKKRNWMMDMWFEKPVENWHCLEYGHEFPEGLRAGMVSHVFHIDIEKIRKIIVECNVVKPEIVTKLSPDTLRSLLVDLSRKKTALEIIKINEKIDHE